MSIYHKWNKDFFEKQNESIAYTKKKDATKANTDLDALTQNFQDLKDLNSLEMDELVVSAAELDVTPEQYYDLYKTTKPIQVNLTNGKPNAITDYLKKVQQIVRDNNKILEQTSKDLGYEKNNKLMTGTLFMGLNSIFDILQRGVVNQLGVPYAQYEEQILAEDGLTRQDMIEFEKKGRNDNQQEWKAASVRARAFLLTLNNYLTTAPETLLNIFGLDTPVDSLVDVEVKSKAWLATQGVVDADGEGYVQQTDIESAIQATKENTLDEIRIQEKELQRDLTQTEKASLALNNWYDIITEETSTNPLLNILGESTPVAENRKLREGYEKAQISSNIGDFASYLVTGNMPGRYSPENVMYEETQELYDLKVLQAEQAFDTGQISITQKNELVDKLEDERDEELTKVAFDPNRGIAGIMGGAMNLVGMYYTDPVVMFAKGVGIAGKVPEKFDEVLAGAQKEMKRFIDEGGTVADFWQNNDEILDGLSTVLVEANNANQPTFLNMINAGFNHKFAKTVADAVDPAIIKEGLIDGFNNGYVSDMVFGKSSLGKTGQFRIQSKVISDNLITTFGAKDIDNSITATGNKVLGSTVKEMVNGTDIRLPNRGQVDLRNIQEAVVMFARVGNVFKVPQSRLNKLLIDFYNAADEGLYTKAQDIYYDGLLRTEGALQLRYLYGLSDGEITEFFGNMKQGPRMFSDDVGDFLTPSRTNEFYPVDEIDILTKRQFSGQVEGIEIPQEFTKNSIELINQFRGYSIEIPDVVGIIKTTSQRRRLRAKALIEKEGIDKVFDKARKAFEDGKRGTFWDEETPMGAEIAAISKGLGDPGILFKGQEKILSSIEKGTFGLVRGVFYPLQLLGRFSYPAKLTVDGHIRASLLGVRSAFRSPLKFLRFLLNDANGALARALGYTPETSLVGPYKITRPLEFQNKSLQGLNEKLPMPVRKALGVLQDSAEYGIPELQSLSSASPTFAFGRRFPDTGYDLINKVGTKNVPMPDGVLDFKLSDEYIEAVQEYFFEYIDDDLSMITAALMKQGLDYTDIAKFYQETPSVQAIIEQANKMMQSRNVYSRGTLPIAYKTEDFDELAKHYVQSINNMTGGSADMIDIIATGKVGRVDLRSPDSMTPENLAIYNAKMKKLTLKNQANMPNQMPKQKPELDERTAFQKGLDSLFFATAQMEADLIRVPLFKQGYEHFIEAGIPFTSKQGLNKIMNAHKDPESPIKLSDEIFKSVQEEYNAIKNLAPDLAVTERTVPVKVFDNGDSLSIIAYSDNGQKQITSLKRLDTFNNELTFDLNLYNTELKVFKKQSAVADYRLGDDGDAIGVYNFSVNKSEAIINGSIPNRDALVRAVTNALDESVDAEALVDNAIEYLASSQGKFDKTITKQELFEVLGIDGSTPNVVGLKVKLQKGKTTKKVKNTQGEITHDVGVTTLNRVLGKKIARPILRKKADVEDAIDRAYEYINANPQGWSIDLGRKNNTNIPGYYVSPYKTRELILDTPVTRKQIEKFITKNKTLLKKEDHVLGGWIENNKLYLDVSVKIKKGVAAQVIDGTDEALAKAQYIAILADQKAIGNITTAGYQGAIPSNTAGAFDVIRRAGQDLLIGSNKKILKPNKAITSPRAGAVIGNDVLQAARIRAIVDEKAGIVKILKPQTNPILNEKTFSGDYQSMLDLSDIKSASTPRVMSMEDLHERAVEYAFELHSRLLYNLTERGFFSQAYRVGFAFFEAWREVLGRYYNLGLANPKAIGQIGFGYRKGIEHNFIYEDPSGEKYLIVPVGGTPFEDYVKTEGRGAFTDDMSLADSKIIAKRGIPLSALNVGGGGLFPPVGPAIALPVGVLVKDKPKAKKNLEKYVFGGFELTGARYDSLEDIPGILLETTIPSVGKNLLNQLATNLDTQGLDEDQWLSAINTGYQVAGILRPDLADDQQALETVAMTLAANFFQLKAWDRFVNPFIPRLSIMYAIEGNEVAFGEWYGTKGEDSGLVYNNFVELSVIHGFYQDIKDEYVMTLGPQGEFYALLEVAKLLGLDNRDLSEGFTSTALQLKGKNISQGGILPRTTPEYDFVLDNPELAADYGPVLTLFAPGLDEGNVDYGGVSYISNLGLFSPKTPDEFYVSTQTFLASAIEVATKDYWSKVIDNSTADPGERVARKKAKFALIEADLAKMFPMAYGNSAELNKVLGSDYETGVPNDVLIDYLERAVKDQRLDNFDNRNEIALYLNYRAQAIDAVADTRGYPIEKDAMRWISTSDTVQAQEVRNQLYTKAQEIGRNNPKFLVIFDKVFSYELTRFGLEG